MSVSCARECDFASFVKTWNEVRNLTAPAIHEDMALWLEDRWRAGDTRLLLMAFRGSGKSTLVGLFCAWLLHHDRGLRILVLAAEMTLAEKLVRNTKRIIERHPACEGMKPARPDQWGNRQFTVERERELRDPSMLAKGMEANVTGARADLIICDDVEVPKTCATAHLRSVLRERLHELDYIITPDGTVLYLGTPHSYFSIYAEEPRPEADEAAAFLVGYQRLELPLLTADGKSRWPERFTGAIVDDLRLRHGPNRFASQMLLTPTAFSEGRLDPHAMPIYDGILDYRAGNGEVRLYLEGRRLLSASCFWDPAYGARHDGDASVIAAVYTDEQGFYWLHGIEYLEVDLSSSAQDDAATQQCRRVVAFADRLHLPSIRIETNGVGKLLPGLLRRAIRETGGSSSVVEHHSHRPKADRILEAFDATLAARRLNVHRSVWESPFVREMREWRPNQSNPSDDGLDAVAGCLLNGPVRLPRLANRSNTHPSKTDWARGGQMYRATSDFDL